MRKNSYLLTWLQQVDLCKRRLELHAFHGGGFRARVRVQPRVSREGKCIILQQTKNRKSCVPFLVSPWEGREDTCWLLGLPKDMLGR